MNIKEIAEKMALLTQKNNGKGFRTIDVELPSGECIKNVNHKDIDSYIMLIEKGQEDFLILSSQDGFLQFFGVDNQFVLEIRVNFPNGDFHTYSVINKSKEYLVERISLTTPYGQFTPTEREVVSLDLVRSVIRKYYENKDERSFLKEIPYIDTTEETKSDMGLD